MTRAKISPLETLVSLRKVIYVINNLSYVDDTTFMAENKEELKSLLMRVKEVREKAVLKQHSKYKDHGIQSDHFMTNRLGKCGNSDRFYILGLQNH